MAAEMRSEGAGRGLWAGRKEGTGVRRVARGSVARPPRARLRRRSGSGHVLLGLGVCERDEALAIAAVFVVRHAVHLGRAQSRPPLSAVLLRDGEKGELVNTTTNTSRCASEGKV